MGDRIQLLVREIHLSLYQPPSSTQPGYPSLGRRNEYQPKGGDALRLGVKADMVLFAGNTVWSISERVRGVCAKMRYTNPRILYFVRYNTSLNMTARVVRSIP